MLVGLRIMQSIFSSAARLQVRPKRRKKSWSRAGELKIRWAKPLARCVRYGFCKGAGVPSRENRPYAVNGKDSVDRVQGLA